MTYPDGAADPMPANAPDSAAPRPPLRIVLVGSNDLEVYPESLLHFMETLPPSTEVRLRRGNKSAPGTFEQVMAMACRELWWMEVSWCTPDPAGGREATFVRDIEMVSGADLVLAFFPGPIMSGGTGHVVQKAMDQGVPCYALGIVNKSFVRIGEHDHHDVWGAKLKEAGI